MTELGNEEDVYVLRRKGGKNKYPFFSKRFWKNGYGVVMESRVDHDPDKQQSERVCFSFEEFNIMATRLGYVKLSNPAIE